MLVNHDSHAVIPPYRRGMTALKISLSLTNPPESADMSAVAVQYMGNLNRKTCVGTKEKVKVRSVPSDMLLIQQESKYSSGGPR